MKIIIEGCDGSGKSTLARRLAGIFNAKIEHDSIPCDLDNYISRLESPENTIYDRFFLGQFVYNKPEERKLGYCDLSYLKEYCAKRPDVILIYFDQDTDVILERLSNRSEEEKIKDRKTMSLFGTNDPKEFVERIKKEYEIYSSGFIRLKGEDVIYE